MKAPSQAALVAASGDRRTVWAAPARAVIAYIGLGSNQGARIDHLRRALFSFLTHPEIRVQAVSPVYETEYVGPGCQDPFLNACVAAETRLAPQVLLAVLKSTEERLGRPAGEHLQPRIIDLDVLLYGDRVAADSRLIVPHPRLRERAFVLAPLADIAPQLRLPDCQETVTAAYAKIRRRSGPWVRLRSEHPLLPEGPAGGEEAWRAALALHCR